LELRKKGIESVKKGVPKSETARHFGVDRATVKRYCKPLDERATLEPRATSMIFWISSAPSLPHLFTKS
jgi:hypothetical protein